MSDRRVSQARRVWGRPRPVRPDWQIAEIDLWRMLCRPHFRNRRVAVERRWRVKTDAGAVVVVRKVR